PWRKPPPPAWLDLCDEMGVMVIGGLPIECMNRWPTVTPMLGERVENEVRSAVLRDRNRACIVQWEMFNEIHRPGLKRLKHPASMLARSLDPTRLILDESGGFAGGANIYLPGRFEPEVFNDVHNYPGAPFNDDSYDQFLALAKTPEQLKIMGLKRSSVRSRTTPGRLTFVSEIGYGSLPDLIDNNARFAMSGNPLTPPYRYHQDLAQWFTDALSESGLDAVYPDLQRFCLDQQAIHSLGNKRMIEAIRSNTSTGGYAVHALTGGDWVIGAGLLDLFRNPKASYWGTKQANQPRYLALRVRPRNIYADRGARVTVRGINDLAGISGRLTVELIASHGAIVWRTERDASLAQGVTDLLDEPLNTLNLSGPCKVRTQLVGADGTTITQNEVDIDVFSEGQLTAPSKPDAKIALLDTGNVLRTFLKQSGVPFVEFNPKTPTALPVFVAKTTPGNPKTLSRFGALEQFVQRGGTAVYLETVQRWNNPMWGGQLPSRDILPVSATIENGKGLWVGVSHVVTDHPVFEGLPASRMMGQIYENVWSPQSLTGTGGELIVGAISHGWYQGEKDEQHHQGPSPAWYGMDMGIVPHGEGRYVLSALRITENLGKDPVADKILFNTIRWLTRGE
ncbi:MAG: glycoside hydrolase family 2 TIM barrel-domain containing protein, partial [Planctomycetota bacterium]